MHGQMTTFLFERMTNLRLLQIIGAPNIKGNFKNLFPNLRCIRWHFCPWTHIPLTFHPPKLVSIDMPSSQFKILWKGPVVYFSLVINLYIIIYKYKFILIYFLCFRKKMNPNSIIYYDIL